MAKRPVPPPIVTRPSPKSSSTLVAPTAMPAPFCSKTKSPARVWPKTSSDALRTARRAYGPASRSSATSVPPTRNDWSIARPVWLNSTETSPETATPDRSTAKVPPRRPARPLDSISKLPLMFVSPIDAPGTPSSIVPSRTPRAIDGAPLVSVTRSKPKVPEISWPPIEMVTSGASNFRNGPAGRFRSTSMPSTRKVSATGRLSVLTAKLKSASSVSNPGTVMPIEPLRRPAIPPGVIKKLPVPPLKLTGPRVAEMFDALIRVTEMPAGVVSCSIANEPLSS